MTFSNQDTIEYATIMWKDDLQMDLHHALERDVRILSVAIPIIYCHILYRKRVLQMQEENRESLLFACIFMDIVCLLFIQIGDWPS